MRIIQDGNEYKLLSDNEQVMYVSSDPKKVEKFMNQYSALKSYSKRLNTVGDLEALKLFREKLKTNEST